MLHRDVPYSFFLLLNYSFPMDSNAQCFIYFIKKNIIIKKFYVYQRKMETEEATFDNRMGNKC